MDEIKKDILETLDRNLDHFDESDSIDELKENMADLITDVAALNSELFDIK